MEVTYQRSNMTCEERDFKKAMASSYITVEWIFEEMKIYFSILDYKHKMKVLQYQAGSLSLAGMQLCNM